MNTEQRDASESIGRRRSANERQVAWPVGGGRLLGHFSLFIPLFYTPVPLSARALTQL